MQEKNNAIIGQGTRGYSACSESNVIQKNNFLMTI